MDLYGCRTRECDSRFCKCNPSGESARYWGGLRNSGNRIRYWHHSSGGFFLGTAITWFGTIELLCHLGEKQSRQIMLRVMQGLSVLCIAAGFVQLARAVNLFGT